MEHWDLTALDVEPHRPQILDSKRGESRTIALRLPAGEELQEHQVHERAHSSSSTARSRSGVTAARRSAAAPACWSIFDPGERHEVRATSDARLLLVLAPWPGQGHPGARDA